MSYHAQAVKELLRRPSTRKIDEEGGNPLATSPDTAATAQAPAQETEHDRLSREAHNDYMRFYRSIRLLICDLTRIYLHYKLFMFGFDPYLSRGRWTKKP